MNDTFAVHFFSGDSCKTVEVKACVYKSWIKLETTEGTVPTVFSGNRDPVCNKPQVGVYGCGDEDAAFLKHLPGFVCFRNFMNREA